MSTPAQPDSQSASESAPLFYERGASWYWVLGGPVSAVAMLFIEHSAGNGFQLLIPSFFLVMVSGFVALQVKAARIHTSVELTEHTLRQGTEVLRVADIVTVYSVPEHSVRASKESELEKWQTARALGELNGVPRGRQGIGLRLTQGRTVQAWARRHRQLRTALTPLVHERTAPAGSDIADDGRDGAGSSP